MAPIDVYEFWGNAIEARQNGDTANQSAPKTFGDWRNTNSEGFVVEAWGEGFMLGALLIMSVITIANMRRGVLLHKLILLEVCPFIWRTRPTHT
jgi:hypothetical protein